MLFWSSSASSCSRSHMAACSSASRASSFFKQCQALAFDKSRHIQRSLLLFVHLPLFSVSTGCRVDPDQVVIVRRCGRRYYNCTSCPVFFRTYHGTAYQLINNPCAVQPLLHKISLCVECFLINNSADTPEKRESVLMPEMPTPHAKNNFFSDFFFINREL